MSLNIVVSADVQQAGKQIDNFSKRSRQALLSLSLVAQDLPFGFIGIQNNLPMVVQQFGKLREESGSVMGALKALGSSLAGPAGLFLAFSAVTSAITFATMKYGSLGAAITSIFGKQTVLNERLKIATESLKDYNKELRTNQDIQETASASQAGQIVKIQALSNIVQDLTNSESIRGNALKKLQEIDKDYFGNLSTAIGDVEKLRKATDLYTDALIRQATIKAYEEEISAIQKQIVNQEILRNGLKESLQIAIRQEKINKTIRDQAARQGGQVAGITDPTVKANAALDEQSVILEKLYINRLNFNEAYKETIRLQTLEAEPEFVKPAKVPKPKVVKPPKELDIAEIERKGRIAANKILNQALANRTKAIAAALKEEERLQNEFRKRQEADIKKDIFAVDPLAALKKTTGPLGLEQDKLALAFKNTNIVLQNTFFQPLTDAFVNLFETGSFNIKEFGKVILTSLRQLVAKIIATGIISLLASILLPGGAIAAGGAAAGTSRFGSAILGLLLGGQVAAPSFAGVGGGQLGFGGSVALTLRGSDLVGAINRTNTTISRVG